MNIPLPSVFEFLQKKNRMLNLELYVACVDEISIVKGIEK